MRRPVDHLLELLADYDRDMLSRRQFVQKASLLGLSAAAIAAALDTRSTSARAARQATPPTGATTPNGERMSAALVTPQKTGDLGPVDSMVDGLNRGGKELNYDVKVVEVVQGEYSEAVRSLASSGTNLVIGAFPPMIDAINDMAPQFPNQRFALIIGETPDVIPNVVSYWELGLEGCFLVGALAGLYSKSGTVGGVLSIRNPEQDRFIAGYQQGVKATNKNAKFVFNVIGGNSPFEDPATAKRLAQLLQEQGADVVCGGGGQSIQGIHDAAAASNGALVSMGMDRDQCLRRPDSTLASVRIYEANMVYKVMKANRDGAWTPGNFLVGIKDGGEDICTFDNSHPVDHQDPETGHVLGPKLPQDVRDMIWNLRQQILDGKLKVENKVQE